MIVGQYLGFLKKTLIFNTNYAYEYFKEELKYFINRR